MTDDRVRPELFAGAAAEAGRADGRPPDVEVVGSFRASQLRHVERPDARVSVDGGPELDREDEVVREGLPERVEPGQVYRDVRLRRRVGVSAVAPRVGGPSREGRHDGE